MKETVNFRIDEETLTKFRKVCDMSSKNKRINEKFCKANWFRKRH